MQLKTVFLITFTLLSFTVQADWKLLYKNDKNGQAIDGDMQSLVEAIRQGLPIRIAWGVSRTPAADSYVEHVIEPTFITATNGMQVFAQTAEHIAQTSYWDNEFQDFNSPQILWRGILSTTGRFTAIWYNRSSGETIRRMPQKAVITWFADVPENPVNTAKMLFETSGD